LRPLGKKAFSKWGAIDRKLTAIVPKMTQIGSIFDMKIGPNWREMVTSHFVSP